MSSARPLAILPGYSDSPATQMEPTGCAVDTYLSSGTTPPRHRHDSYELFILYSGAAVLSPQHGREVLTPGDAALFYGGTLHGARSVTGMYRRTAIHFVSDRLSTAISDQLPAAGEGLRAFSLPAETLEKLLRDAKGLRALSDAGDAKRTTMMLEKISLGVSRMICQAVVPGAISRLFCKLLFSTWSNILSKPAPPEKSRASFTSRKDTCIDCSSNTSGARRKNSGSISKSNLPVTCS